MRCQWQNDGESSTRRTVAKLDVSVDGLDERSRNGPAQAGPAFGATAGEEGLEHSLHRQGRRSMVQIDFL
jgi:hypothetical protein